VVQILAKEQEVMPFEISNVELGDLSCFLHPLLSPIVAPELLNSSNFQAVTPFNRIFIHYFMVVRWIY
jgi:hypothetical protein